jgi:hypothetical protein
MLLLLLANLPAVGRYFVQWMCPSSQRDEIFVEKHINKDKV